MGGKASLLLVIAFNIIFMIAGRHFNEMATRTTINSVDYFTDAKLHTLTSSGINLVANRLFLKSTQNDTTYNFSLDGGTITAVLTTLNQAQRIRQLVATGTYGSQTSSVKIVVKPSSFSKFAYFSDSEGGNIWWTSRDTVWGPFHTNDNLRIANNPVFYGKVTVGGTQIKYNNQANAQYLGGYQEGINIPITTNGVSDAQTAAAAGGANTTNQTLVYFEFRGDSIRYRYSANGAWTYRLASAYAPNGVISFQNAEVHVKGTVKGQYTLAVSGPSNQNRGNIYIDDDLVYYSNPKTNPNSTDMLGLAAQQNIIITNNAANNNNVVIQASMYAERGSFTAENYNNRPVSGFIDLYGGITQYSRGPVGQFQGNNIVNGFSKRYRYDDRFMIQSPPAFPGTGKFEIVSWFE
jgi:hypothetical protein